MVLYSLCIVGLPLAEALVAKQEAAMAREPADQSDAPKGVRAVGYVRSWTVLDCDCDGPSAFPPHDDDDNFTPTKHLTPPPHHSSRSQVTNRTDLPLALDTGRGRRESLDTGMGRRQSHGMEQDPRVHPSWAVLDGGGPPTLPPQVTNRNYFTFAPWPKEEPKVSSGCAEGGPCGLVVREGCRGGPLKPDSWLHGTEQCPASSSVAPPASPLRYLSAAALHPGALPVEPPFTAKSYSPATSHSPPNSYFRADYSPASSASSPANALPANAVPAKPLPARPLPARTGDAPSGEVPLLVTLALPAKPLPAKPLPAKRRVHGASTDTSWGVFTSKPPVLTPEAPASPDTFPDTFPRAPLDGLGGSTGGPTREGGGEGEREPNTLVLPTLQISEQSMPASTSPRPLLPRSSSWNTGGSGWNTGGGSSSCNNGGGSSSWNTGGGGWNTGGGGSGGGEWNTGGGGCHPGRGGGLPPLCLAAAAGLPTLPRLASAPEVRNLEDKRPLCPLCELSSKGLEDNWQSGLLSPTRNALARGEGRRTPAVGAHTGGGLSLGHTLGGCSLGHTIEGISLGCTGRGHQLWQTVWDCSMGCTEG